MRIVAAIGLMVSLTHCASSEPSEVTSGQSERAIANARRDLTRSVQGLQTRVMSDGTHATQIASGHRHATIVTRSADGTRKIRCVHEASEAEAMLRGERE